MSEGRYRGFAQIEYEYVRRRSAPGFEWTTFERPSARQRLRRPLAEARVALVATAGAYLRGQKRFSLEDEGDPSFREIPADAHEFRLAHPGYDVRRALRDPSVVFPLAVLREMAGESAIGEMAPRAFSFMGYIPDTRPLLAETAPAVAQRLQADQVDLVLLVPS